MRELKFRAHKVTGEWAHFTIDDLIHHSMKVPNWVYEYPAIEKEQFTGLLDKNGKEIYDGDLIGCRSGIMRVEYSEDIACFEATNGIGSRGLYGYVADSGVEVIGNIYENPELLK